MVNPPYRHPSYKNFNAAQLHDAKLLAKIHKAYFPFMMFGKGSTNENPNFRALLNTISRLSTSRGKRFLEKVIRPKFLHTGKKSITTPMEFEVTKPFVDYFIKYGINVEKWSNMNREWGTWKRGRDDVYMDDEEIMERSIRYAKRLWRKEDKRKTERIERKFRRLKTEEAREVGEKVLLNLMRFRRDVARLQKQIYKFANSNKIAYNNSI